MTLLSDRDHQRTSQTQNQVPPAPVSAASERPAVAPTASATVTTSTAAAASTIATSSSAARAAAAAVTAVAVASAAVANNPSSNAARPFAPPLVDSAAPSNACHPVSASAPSPVPPTLSSARFTPRKRPASVMLDLGQSATATKDEPRPAVDAEDVDMQPPTLPQPLQFPLPLDHLLRQGEQLPQSLAEHHPRPLPLPVQDDEMSTAQRLYDVTLDSPGSPGAYKRMRSSAHSDAGSSSCKDMDEPDVPAPDSVPALCSQLRQLLNYVASKPTLQNGSASFMRDYLRTMLIQSSIAAEEAIENASKAHKAEVIAGRRKSNECFKRLPDELAKHIFSFLDGKNLARVREVCRKWDEFACDEQLWKALCLKRWRSLETDPAVWKLIDSNISMTMPPNKWRLIYPKVCKRAQWKCRLQKTGRFICNLVAHQISGAPLPEPGLPSILVVERRFNILHLQTFVLPEASVLYFEPEEESDRVGFDDFIEYLNKRTRAGLALEEQKRFIFIPPCAYTREHVHYEGKSLLGVVQTAYPPLAP